MKYTLSLVGLALLSFTLILGCGKPEQPAKAQKAATLPKTGAEQAASAAKPGPAQTEKEQEPNSDLNQALLAYLAKTKVEPQYATPRQTALLDLNGDGRQDALVLLENPLYFCGTGGCTMLVFKGTSSGFEFVSSSSLIRGPLLVSETKTHGWRDLIVEVSGGGMAAKQVALKFTGSKYPLNPSMLPPLPNNQTVKGTKIFQGKPQEHGQSGTPKLLVYDEAGMAIKTEYPDSMVVQGTASGEGSGFIFNFKPRENALDTAKVHIFLPRGAATAAAQEPFITGPRGLFASNGWKKSDETTDTGKFSYGWIRKVISFTDPGNKGMVGEILLGEVSGQAVEVILYYPADRRPEFLTNAEVILGNLQFKFKSDKLPFGKSH
jgi:hypothetical protein